MTEASCRSADGFGVSVVVTNYNGRALLERSLPSIAAAVRAYGGPSEVLIVDDCSTDDSCEYICRNFPAMTLLRPEKNMGFQGASNFGFARAKFPILISLNNDIEVTPESFGQMVRHFESPDVFAVSTKVHMWDRTTYLAGRRVGVYRHGHLNLVDNPGNGEVTPTLFATGGACAFDREKLLALGGFDPIFHPLYWEDIDLCYRAWKRGWRVLYDPGILLYHKHRATIETLVEPGKLRRVTARNSYLFLWKNLSGRALAAHLVFLPLFLIRDVVTGRWRFPAAFGMALSRLPEAWRGRRRDRPHWRRSDLQVFSIQSE